MSHDQLRQEAILAVQRLHGDTNVPPTTTRDSLETVREELTSLIEAVEADIAKLSENS